MILMEKLTARQIRLRRASAYQAGGGLPARHLLNRSSDLAQGIRSGAGFN